MAIVKKCNVSASVQNTGIECSAAMGATKMFLLVPSGVTWTANQIADFVTTINTARHGASASRVYPIFGNQAPIITINVNDEDDVTEKFDNGSEVFVRSGFANRIYETNQGGLCYAKALRSFLNSGYYFVEVDDQGNFIVKKNEDGTFSGFPAAYLGGKTPTAGSFKTVYKNRFGISYDPTIYINSGEIYSNGEGLLDLMGLIDAELSDAGSPSTTGVNVSIKTECAETDLVALLDSEWAQVSNFVVTKVSDGSAVTPSAVTIVGGHVHIAGTFASASVYTVALAAPSVLKTNGIEGYEGTVSVDITIP